MRRVCTQMLLVVLMCGGGCTEDTLDKGEWTQKASQALKPFKINLKSTLMKGLAKGPVAAIDACRLEAPAIAGQASTASIKIGRSSHKLRNPENKPKPWVEPLLKDYVSHGSKDAKLVRIDRKRVGYVEPIFVDPPCLICHGSNITEDVGEALSSLYPSDRATGFELGDFRGVFWVELDKQ